MDSPAEYARANNIAILELSGDLDDVASDSLEQAIFEKALISDGRVAVDMSRVRYVQSPALGVLLKMSRKMGKLGGGLAIVGADDNLSRLCHVTGLDMGLNMFDDLPSAAAYLDRRTAS